jgi:DNA-binding transcriptional MerR regulator
MNGVGISDLAETVGVATSTIRYYERIGLVPEPPRTPGGYRQYDEQATARLRFIVRGKQLGLSLEQIGELLGVWDGTNCAGAKEHLYELLDDKQSEITVQIRELRRFSRQLSDVREQLLSTTAPAHCTPELECCAPSLNDDSVPAACTLDRNAFTDRMSEFHALFERALIGREQSADSIRFRFANRDGVEAQVRDLAARELECCSFFRFTIAAETDEVWWDVAVDDPAAQPVLADLFALPERVAGAGTGA